MTLLPLLFVACSFGPDTPFDGAKRPPTQRFEDPDLSTPSGPQVHQLWRMDGRVELPDTSLPEGFDADALLPLAFDTRPTVRKNKTLWLAPSPFRDHVDGRRGAPAGMALEVDNEVLAYDRGMKKPKTWRLIDGVVEVRWTDEDPLGPGRFPGLRYADAAGVLLRRDPSLSGLPTDEFVVYDVTHQNRTRPGLLLPAPASATYALELPEGAVTFDTSVTMSPTPLRKLGSDGAWAVVTVTAGGAATELSRTWIDGDTDDFQPLRHDLSKWAGQTIELTLATEAHDHAHFDHVVFTAPTVWSSPVEPPRRVIVIGLDTTRPQQFGFYGYDRDTTPELDDIAEHATVFTKAWTPAPRTRPSFRSATTGRRPLDAVGATNIGQVFSEHGFATAGFVANVHLVPRFDFDHGFDDWWFDGLAQAEDQVDRALAFLETYRERDTYIFLHIMDPHMAYGAPGSYRDQFVVDADPDLPTWFARSDVYKWMRDGSLTEQRKAHIEALYDGELRYTSHHLARLFDQLDRLEGRSLVVVHNDHGEEFWEHGTFEHNHTLYDDVTRGILWFRAGGGQVEGRTIDAPVSLPDIAPTLYDFAGFDADALPVTDGRSLKGLLEGTEDAATWAERPIGIAHLRYGYDRWGVVFRNHKYILHTGSGNEELYDLAADPLEQKDLARTTDLDPWRAQLGPAHGIDAGFGWRVRIRQVPAGDTISFALPAPAKWAQVVPPSMTIKNPANQAWGEPPRRPIEEIGSVALSEDGRTLTYTAGTKPKAGLLFVRFPTEVSPEGTSMTSGEASLPLLRTTVWSHSGPQRTLRIEPGTVLRIPPGEAARMNGGEASEAEIRQLCELGYIHGPKCDALGVP